MINVDTKIGSKALCKRLEKVLPDIIHYNQNAFVQGKSIFDAIRTIDDIMVLEIFAIHVRENKCIKGIVVEDEEIKLCSFADDLTTFLRDVSSYKNLVESLNRFEQCSVELGISKIEIPIKILGIHWTYNQQERDKLNFYNLLESIKKQLTFWKWRYLTIIGKIQILKTFIILKLTYRASIIHYSKDTLKQCNKILYHFVWNGRDKVKRMAIVNEIENGGLKMPHWNPSSRLK